MENVKHNKIRVQRTAHYSTFGELSKTKTKYVWIVLHGYGQLSKRLINKYADFDPEEHFVIMPEGLNRFYWAKNNSPVACWMTSEDRYDEIDDFVNYLDTIYNNYCRHLNQDKVKFVVMGFSQGCATMWRWLHASQPHFDIILNWAGWIPEDLSYLHLKNYLSKRQLHMLYGDNDQFITEEALSDIKSVINENDMEVNIHKYEGQHKIPKEVLKQFSQQHVVLT